MLALLGHNGASKTTLMKIILGLLKPDAGTARVLGQTPGIGKPALGYVPEDVNFYPALTGLETLTYFARLKGLSRRDSDRVSARLLDSVHLHAARTRPVKHYSKGMKQRLGLAQALLPSALDGITYCEPTLLILDEPTVGLDPIATMDFYQLLATLQAHGCGIIICTHVLPGLERFIDTALILSHGTVVASGSISALHKQAQLPTVLHTQGLNGALSQDPILSPFFVNPTQLAVPATHKLAVLEHLLKDKHLTDIHLQSPTLPELYQHFVAHADQESNHVQ